jgi:hypothetical protein
VNDNTLATPDAATPLVEPSPLELIQQGITALFDPTDVVEVRVPKAGKLGTLSGYYSDHAEMAQDLATLDGKHPGIYTTLNPVNPALLARAENRTKSRAESTTSDNDIAHRIHLLIDADPVRPTGISSTDEEKEHSHTQTRSVFKYLRSLGWPDPIAADSGNGFHLIYNIDLPNDKESADLVKAVLNALAARFNTAESKIDVSVFNAARIVKAYGTLAAKGDNIESRPHRRSRILKVGSKMTVTVEQLQSVAAEVSSPALTNTSSTGTTSGSITPEQVEANLERCGIGQAERLRARLEKLSDSQDEKVSISAASALKDIYVAELAAKTKEDSIAPLRAEILDLKRSLKAAEEALAPTTEERDTLSLEVITLREQVAKHGALQEQLDTMIAEQAKMLCDMVDRNHLHPGALASYLLCHALLQHWSGYPDLVVPVEQPAPVEVLTPSEQFAVDQVNLDTVFAIVDGVEISERYLNSLPSRDELKIRRKLEKGHAGNQTFDTYLEIKDIQHQQAAEKARKAQEESRLRPRSKHCKISRWTEPIKHFEWNKRHAH